MKLKPITYEQAKKKWPSSHTLMAESNEYHQIVNQNMMTYNEAIEDMEELKKAKRDNRKRVEKMIVGVNPEIMAQVSALTDRINLLENLHENHCIATAHQRDKLFDRIYKLETQIAVIHAGDTEWQKDVIKSGDKVRHGDTVYYPIVKKQ